MNFFTARLKKPAQCLIIIVSAIFCISCIVWLVHFPGIRRVYMFESSDNGKICMESRFLPLRPVQGRVNMYVDELLLGPETSRYRPLFSPGTKALSCFRRGGTLYVDLSDTLLTESGGASEIKKGIKLFRKNILHNFENIRTVEVFVGGRLAYEDN
jgi:Sporulation and spore germination.